MADDDKLNVDLGVGSNDLDAQLRRTFEAMTVGLKTAQAVQATIDNTIKTQRDLRIEIEATNKAIAGGGVDALKGEARKKEQLVTQQRLNLEISKEIQLQREAGLARGSAREAQDGARLADGRTAAQARLTEKAISDAITGINTTSDQLTARLAIAASKAAERMLGATADALEKSYAVAAQRQMGRNAQLSVPGFLDARTVNQRVRAEGEVALAATGATLEDRNARKDAERLATLRANSIRRQAERENAEFDRDMARRAAGLQADAAFEDRERTRKMSVIQRRAEVDNRQFDRERALSDNAMRSAAEFENRQDTLRKNRLRRDAERENAEFDRQAARVQTATINDARYEDAQRSRATALLQRRAEADNRQFDREKTQADNALRAAAVFEDRQRTLAANRIRREAERDNASFDKARGTQLSPDTALRAVRKEETFMAQTGMSRSAWEAQIKSENLSTEAQIAIIQRLRAERKRLADEERAGNRPQPRTEAERIAAQVRNRNALFDSNGGADMLQFQAKLASNYAIFGAVTGAITGTLKALNEFDDNLKRFQAITGTADVEMTKVRAGLLEIGAASKFSVNEITGVAIALGQTGLAGNDVVKALKPVIDLAAASGSSLQESVEAITAVLGAYNMEAGRAGDVADVFVAALNRTKLTMGQLQLGIQYAANIARDSGVSFSELTASIGAIAQAGVKSGSTIGTGMRQLITEFSAPTDKLRGVLKELGINLSDVDLRTQGFTGVLENLRAKGFGTAEALRSLDLRAAAAFSALVGQTDKIKLLEQEFLLTSAATEGAAKANESLSASATRLGNVVFALADQAFGPLVTAMAGAVNATTEILGGFNKLGPLLPGIAAGLTAVAAAAAAVKIGGLLNGLLSSGIGALAANPALLVAGAAIAGAGGILAYLTSLQSEAQAAKARLDALKGVENEVLSRQNTITVAAADVDKRIQGLIDRTDKLNNDPILRRNAIIDAQKAFGELGLVVNTGAANIGELIVALQNLRGELSKEMPGLLAQQLESLNEQIKQLKILQDERAREQATKGIRTTNIGEVRFGATPEFTETPQQRRAKLGDAFATAGDYIDGRQKLPLDNLGAAGPIRGAMNEEFLKLDDARRNLGLQPQTPQRDAALAALEARIQAITAVMKDFETVVKSTSDIMGKMTAAENVRRQAEGSVVQASPEYIELANRRRALYGQQDQAILRASAKPGLAGAEAMTEAMRGTDDAARTGLADIDRQKFEQVIFNKRDPKAVEDAFAELVSLYNSLLKGFTTETKQRFDAAKPAALAQLNTGIRTDERQLELIARQAADSRDPAVVAEKAALAKSVQEEINAYRLKIFQINQGAVRELSPEAQVQKAEIQEQAKIALDKLSLQYFDLNRKALEQALTFREANELSSKAVIEKQIQGLEKVRDDVRSTPEAMRNAVQEINRLLGQVAEIGKSVNQINAEKTGLQPLTGNVPAATPRPGTVQAEIVNTLKAMNREDLIDYAVGTAQRESSFNPNAVSSANAKGVFQFKDDTFKNSGGTGDIFSVQEQIKAFINLHDADKKAFKAAFGYDPSPAELYLLHQQGEAGGKALLRAPAGTSAVDALTPAYRNNGGAATALQAVKGNLPNDQKALAATISAADFVESRKAQFRTSLAGAGRFTPRTEQEALKDRQADQDDATAEELRNARAKNAEREAAANRARNLAQLNKVDTELTETYSGQKEAIKRALTPAEAINANATAMETLKKLFETAVARDENKPDRQDEEGRKADRETRRKTFSATAQDQAITAADTIGKATLKVYADQIALKEAEKKELERPDNLAKAGNTDRLNVLNGEIESLTRRKELEGEFAANGAKQLALETALRDIKAAGLGTEEQQLQIQSRLVELKDRQKILEPQVNVARQQAATPSSLQGAAEGATDDFLKSRGILDIKGNVVDPMVQARKTLTEELSAIGNAFDGLWVNLVNGSMTAGDALKKFATDIATNVLGSLSKSLTNDIMKSLFSSGGTGEKSGTGIIGELFSAILPGKAQGGIIRMAGGGRVPMGDAAAAGRDSKLAMLMPGEYVMRKSAVDAIGQGALDQVNALGNTMVNRAPKVDAAQKFGGSSAQADVYIVDREQVPPPSRNEIVHYIGDDIQRGGTIKQLIKSVAAGGR